MKTKILLTIGSGLLLLFVVPGCLKNDDEELMNEEQTKLQNYLKTHNYSYTLTSDGLYYRETKSGKGLTPGDSDFVLINTAWYTIDHNMVRTNDTVVAKEKNIIPFNSYKGPQKIYLPYYYTGISEGIKKMSEGSKFELVVPSKLALGGNEVTDIPRYSTLIVDIELVRVIKDPITDSKAFIDKYLDTLNLNENDLIDGIYMKVDSEGTGDVPSSYDTVTLQYREKALDTAFVIGNYKYSTSKYLVDHDSIIPGLKVAIMKLKTGSEARIILPYNMAWGKGGYGRYITPTDIIADIPPYTSFLYQIKILKIGRSAYYK